MTEQHTAAHTPATTATPELEPVDDFLSGVAYGVGQALRTAAQNTEQSYPGWSTFFGELYEVLDGVFGQ